MPTWSLRPVREGWRLTITLDGVDEPTLAALLDRVRGEVADEDGAAGPDATIVHAYSPDLAAALASEDEACELLDDTEAGYETQLDRWDPDVEDWVEETVDTATGPAAEEWRLTAHLIGDDAEVGALVAMAADRIGSADRVTRAGRQLRIYTRSETDAARAEESLLALLEETSLDYELWQERWEPAEGAWEELAPDPAPDDPDGDAPGPAQARRAEAPVWEGTIPELDPASIPGMGERRRGCWVVKVELADATAAEAFHESLRARGLVVGRVAHKVGMLVADSGTAGYVAALLEEHGGAVTTAEASRVERVAYGIS